MPDLDEYEFEDDVVEEPTHLCAHCKLEDIPLQFRLCDMCEENQKLVRSGG